MCPFLCLACPTIYEYVNKIDCAQTQEELVELELSEIDAWFVLKGHLYQDSHKVTVNDCVNFHFRARIRSCKGLVIYDPSAEGWSNLN